MDRQGIFTFSEREIEARDENTLVALVNELIWNQALRRKLPLDRIHTTLRINQPDDGIDALTDLRGFENDPFLGSGLMAWQFKKWSCPASVDT